MATVVALYRKTQRILTDEYAVLDIVDGQQRLTTLILLLKAITGSPNIDEQISLDLTSMLVKQDSASLLLLQTNHDSSGHFADYIRNGVSAKPDAAQTSADRELLLAIKECEEFVSEWREQGRSIEQLVNHLKNRLSFIFHQIDNEKTVYTVFEVLNSRGLDVSWLDRLKSMLMAVIFESDSGNKKELIDEVHRVWSGIYKTIGLGFNLSTESLRFSATLRCATQPYRLVAEEDGARQLHKQSVLGAKEVINTSKWISSVAKELDLLGKDRSRSAITKISHARLLAVAVRLRLDFRCKQRRRMEKIWENINFRIYGMYSKDARTAVGDYVRLSWGIQNEGLSERAVISKMREIGNEYPIESAIMQLRKEDCYSGWQEELRYLLYKYEEYLAQLAGQNFDNEQWARIWESSAADSIEHILPQSSGRTYIHWLGNLTVLPPRLNSKLRDKKPLKKATDYRL